MPPKHDTAGLFLDPTQREQAPQRGAIGSSIARIKSIDADKRQLTATVSTPNIDRYEEMVEPKAFKNWLDVFNTNPVLCAGHTYCGWAGEPTVIGHWSSVDIANDGLIGVAQFATTDLAEEYWKLYRDGHMRAFSVGWITHAWEMREFKRSEGVTKKIRVFTDVELIEISAVAIPANRESLVRAASANGNGTRHNDLAEQVIKQLEACLSDPLGPMSIALKNALDDWHAQRGHEEHGEGDCPGHATPRQDEQAGVIDQIQRSLNDLRSKLK